MEQTASPDWKIKLLGYIVETMRKLEKDYEIIRS
jgi:hypothetical protein